MMRSNVSKEKIENVQHKIDFKTVNRQLTMFAKTNRKSAVWFPCLAATFSSATSATCKYLCSMELEVLPLMSYLLAGPTNFEVAPRKTNNEQKYVSILVDYCNLELT